MLNEHNPTKWSGTQGLQSLEVLQTSRILNASNRNDMKDMENQQRKYTLVRKPRLGLQNIKNLKLYCSALSTPRNQAQFFVTRSLKNRTPFKIICKSHPTKAYTKKVNIF